MSPLLFVTDLDGTLLDHHSYDFSAAEYALAHLKALQIPVVPNSSKTRTEISACSEQMQLNDGFICENGSALWLPENPFGVPDDNAPPQMQVLGRPFAEIDAFLAQAQNHFHFTRITTMPIADFCAVTGLSAAAAQAARQREFSDGLIWQDTEARRRHFCREAHNAGFNTLQGGRFLSVMGDIDKARALAALRQRFKAVRGIEPHLVAFGDSENDRAMLEAADTAVIIRNPDHEPPELEAPDVIVSCDYGPVGWNEAVNQLLRRFDLPSSGTAI